MIRILSILERNHFDGVIIPDHTPQMSCAAPWHAGMAHTLGFILAVKAMLESSNHSRAPLLIAASVSTLGGLLFGYDNIVISGAIGYLTQLFHLDAAGTGWAAGCALIGCIIGCAAAGTVADYLGKKKGLALCAVCFALSSAGMLFAANLHQFVAWRLIGGLGIGAASVISPNYIAEIAPTRVRGRCVTLYQLGIVVGILAAVFANKIGRAHV